jgi:Gram-negative bacterial TonB protein C-terminal
MRYSSVCFIALLLLLLQILHPLPLTTCPNAPREVSAAERNPDADGIYHVGDGVSTPRALYAPEPETTKEARQRHLRGTVVVWAIVAEDGVPKDVHLARSIGEDLAPQDKNLAGSLNGNAIKCVQQSRYEPARFKGKPVPVQIEVRVSYRAD